MQEEYSFQPQINTRSRRLARRAPTLRERQEQQERSRRSTSSEHPAQRRPSHSPASVPRTVVRAQTAKPFMTTKSNGSNDDDAAQSVWALWRAVAAGEDREEEKQYLQAEPNAEGAALPRPPIVYVATVLSMLMSLGIRAPQHAALVEKFLTAVGARDDDKEIAFVEAERFAYVFTTVWKAAVTNRTRWSPAPVRSRALRSVSTVVRPAQRLSCSSLSPSRVLEKPQQSPSLRVAETGSSSGTSSPVTPRSASALSSSPSASQCQARPLSSVDAKSTFRGPLEPRAFLTRSVSCEFLSDNDDVRAGNSSSKVDADGASSEDGSFLHTNISRTASPPPTLQDEATEVHAKPVSLSPCSTENAPGLSLSPEPRDPHDKLSARTTSRITHHRTPFTTPAPMLWRTQHAGSSTRVLASDSHLLTSTTSREAKKATKRVPGGLMRECTFRPKINDVSHEPHHGSVKAADSRRRAEHVDAAPPIQPNTQQYHKERAELVWWVGKPFKQSVHASNGNEQHSAPNELEVDGRDASPLAMVTGFDTAVRRMITARQQQQLHGQSTFDRPAPAPPKRQSALRRAEAQPLLYVDVDLPHGDAGRLALFHGSDVVKVAKEFSALHNLDDRLCRRLENILHEQLLAFS
ncbi:hypothetical protein ABL78_2445 [Leptomonas seymouri]|uniref:Uncharacterized protein n=1 Tax=Leptomonas seymouri TaxID=5684 RepID=A0A0N1I0U0_LEPSE|nr:hypothetical protein ABL78_2445 [Leptomonas seymouri]|eukprot:KPI88432.1 hypothetical protein ABL78_2445 [Leptomonas seymouri]